MAVLGLSLAAGGGLNGVSKCLITQSQHLQCTQSDLIPLKAHRQTINGGLRNKLHKPI